MKKRICAGNWKLNKSPKEASAFLEEFFSQVKKEDLGDFLIFPPAADWFLFAGQNKVSWGGQNCHFESTGAFTGENSAQVMKEMGAEYCLVGHSERRHVFGEPNEWMLKKVKCLQSQDLFPVLCVGETLEERQNGRTEEVIGQQLQSVLNGIDKGSALWVAYEPVWAIGTGQVASPQQAEEAHVFLRSLLDKAWGAEKSSKVPLLYGGSVKPENASELFDQPHVDGFLIGGSSLKVDSFLGIHSEL